MSRTVYILHFTAFPEHQGGIEHWLTHMLKQSVSIGINCAIVTSMSDDPPFYKIEWSDQLRLYKTVNRDAQMPPRLASSASRVARLTKAILLLWRWAIWSIQAAIIVRRRVRDGDVIWGVQIVPSAFPVALMRLLGSGASSYGLLRNVLAKDLRELGRPQLASVFSLVERFFARVFTGLISNGTDTALYAEAELHRNSVVIPNGVDVSYFSRTSDSEARSSAVVSPHLGSMSIVNVGTLIDIKGIRQAIRALSILRNQYGIDCILTLVGKGDSVPYARLAEELGVLDAVRFAGMQQDVRPYLWSADIALGISGGGGVGHAALEMLAAACPIVAWDSLTYSQFLKDMRTAVLVPYGDAVALARGIRTVLEEPSLARDMARNARLLAKAYDWSVIFGLFAAATGLKAENLELLGGADE